MAKQLLLADDSATISRMVQITFAHEDYALTAVKSGDDALARARAARPDVILLDAGLVGKSGYDTCAELRAAGLTDVPVVILTSNFSPYDEARGQQAGADGFVVKPFETQALIDRIGQLIASRGGARPAAVVPSPSAPVVVSAPSAPSPTVTATRMPAMAPLAPPSPTIQNMPPMTPRAPVAPTPPAPRPPAPAPVQAAPPAVAPPGPPVIVSAPTPPIAPRPPPRATLMGLPTVGPDGLPVIATSQGVIRPPAPAAPAAPPAHVAPPLSSSAAAPTLSMMAPSLPTPVVMPAPIQLPPVEPIAHAPVTAPIVAPMAPAPSVIERSAPIGSTQANHAVHATQTTAIPANAPKMPRASLVPRAPTPRAAAAMAAASANASASVAPAVADALSNLAARGPEYAALAQLSREVLEQIAWEVVPELAEAIIRSQLDRLVKDKQRSAE